MNFILKVIISTLAVLLTSYLLPKSMVYVDGVTTSLIVALTLAFLNAIVKPIMVLLTLPATVFTLGLFLLVINALIIMITDHFIDGFKVYGFWSAVLFSVILTIVTSIFEAIARNDNRR
ncbi:MAG TPA: phage holin family protein [Bacteroidia bacterium]|jgi:putative membrane protein|nr:phage holin family protein [Bacteroidia bacterium]